MARPRRIVSTFARNLGCSRLPLTKNPTSFRLSEECLRRVARLSETLGINPTAVIEQAVRRLARSELSADQRDASKGRRPPGRSEK